MSETDTLTAQPGELWTLDDLERLWKAPGPTPAARRKWVKRRVLAWGVPHSDERNEPRFLPGEVLRATQKAMGGRSNRR